MYERDYERPQSRRQGSRPPQKRRRRRRRGGGGLLLTCLAFLAACALLYSALRMPKDEGDDRNLPAKGQIVTPVSLDQPGNGSDAQDPAGSQTAGEPQEPGEPKEPDPLDPEVPQLPGDPSEPSEPSAEIDKDAWNLMLVNPWNAMPRDYAITTKPLSNGHSVDERCYDALQEMLSACRSAGLTPVICSSFRSWEKQEQLYQNKVKRLMNQGLSEADALVEAGTVVAIPGTSEHQLGLAVDIVDVTNQNLDESQEKTAVQRWLMEHSYEYGFILRFPNDKSDITGIIYEPWHYRYVGKEAAKEIHDQGVCLEEYLEGLE